MLTERSAKPFKGEKLFGPRAYALSPVVLEGDAIEHCFFRREEVLKRLHDTLERQPVTFNGDIVDCRLRGGYIQRHGAYWGGTAIVLEVSTPSIGAKEISLMFQEDYVVYAEKSGMFYKDGKPLERPDEPGVAYLMPELP